MSSLFFVRYKRVVFGTFALVFIPCLLVTLFAIPTYYAIAVVALPAGSDPNAEARRLLKRDLLPPFAFRTQYEVMPAPSGRIAALMVEAESPEYTADFANAWAENYAVMQGDARFVVRKAIVPRSPVRPKIRQNLIVGSVLGLMLGFLFAFVRALAGDMIKAVTRGKVRPAT